MKINKENIRYFVKKVKNMGFFHLLSANVLIQLFAFASQLFVAGILSPDDLGRIKIIQTYMSIFSILAGMGFSASTLKICSEGRSREEVNGYFNAALVFTIISTGIVYAIILIINALKLFSSDTLVRILIPIGLFPIVTNSLFLIYIAYFQAIREIKVFSGLTVYNKLLSIIGIILLTYLWGIYGYYIAFNLSYLLMLIAAFFIIKKRVKLKLKIDYKRYFPEHREYAKSSLFSNIIGETSAYADILLMGYLIKDMHEIGYYSFALTLTIALRIFPSTVQQITIPYFSSFKSNKSAFLKIFRKYNRLLYSVVILSLLIFIFLAPPALKLIFDGRYDASIPYLILLSTGWSIRNLNQLQSAAIFGLGKIQYNAYVALFTLVANVIACLVFITNFGVMGAAYASITGGLVIWIASRIYFRKAVRNTQWEIE